MFNFRTTRNRLYDKIHKTTVSVLMGLTVFGAAAVGYVFYDWWFVYRPQVVKDHKEKLLAEGQSEFDNE